MAALWDLGPGAASAMSALLQVVDEEDLAISTGAIEAVSRIDPATGRTLKQRIGAVRLPRAIARPILFGMIRVRGEVSLGVLSSG